MMQDLGKGNYVDTVVVPKQHVQVSCHTPTSQTNEMLVQVNLAGTNDDCCPSRTESGRAFDGVATGASWWSRTPSSRCRSLDTRRVLRHELMRYLFRLTSPTPMTTAAPPRRRAAGRLTRSPRRGMTSRPRVGYSPPSRTPTSDVSNPATGLRG